MATKTSKIENGIVLYTLREGAERTGYNLHYFRRQCKTGRFQHTKAGPHIFFNPAQYAALPTTKLRDNLPNIFDGLDE